MLACFGLAPPDECEPGELERPSRLSTVVDQFGNEGLEPCGRMLGPRYPHSWTTGACAEYGAFYNNYKEFLQKSPVPIRGSAGPVGTPSIATFRAQDPDDGDLVYGAGDQLLVSLSARWLSACRVGGRNWPRRRRRCGVRAWS